ncbi:MAG: LamG-like jellyroll fold domain-containing protein [Planctomycetaceae bacterium]
MKVLSLTTRIVCGCLLILADSIVVRDTCAGAEPNDTLLHAVSFYASFDEEIRGDFGAGDLLPQTRFDHPEQKGEFVFEKGYRSEAFRINRDKGQRGGSLEGLDVLPRRGRLFFPAKGNLAYDSSGWGGAASFWLNTDPNTLLKTPFCDPIQITEKGANNGGLWVDFPDVKPRSFRLGAFRGVKEGGKGISEDDPAAPLVHVKNVGFKSGDWHHVLMNWDRFDTGKDDAVAALYIDGKRMGELKNRDIAMLWNLDHTGIYVGVNYIGLLDELALFNRVLTDEEIARLAKDPGLLTSLKNAKPGDRDESEENSLLRIPNSETTAISIVELETLARCGFRCLDGL